MKRVICLLSLLILPVFPAHAGQWVLRETDTEVFVEYVPSEEDSKASVSQQAEKERMLAAEQKEAERKRAVGERRAAAKKASEEEADKSDEQKTDER